MRIVSADIETSGLDRHVHDLVEFGAILDDLKNPKNLDSLPRFHCYFISEKYVGSPFALSLHSVAFRRIADRTPGFTYVSPMKFGNLFKQFLVKNGYELEHDMVTITVAGKNFAAFDLPFLEEKSDLLKHVNIRHRILDPAVLFLTKDDNVLPGTETCKSRMGINEKTAHMALDDAMDVIKMVRFKLGSLFKENKS